MSFASALARLSNALTKLTKPPVDHRSVSSGTPCGREQTEKHASVSFGSAACLESSASESDVAVREVLGYPAAWLVDLPRPTVLVLCTAAATHFVVDLRYQPCAGAFTAHDWLSLISAAEERTAGSGDLERWVGNKRANPEWGLTPGETGAAIKRPGMLPSWSVVGVLAAYGATLIAVHLDQPTRLEAR